MKQGKVFLGLLILVIASCYLPQNPGQLDGTDKEVDLSVVTDGSRDQGVYVNEKGESFDIISEEGPGGEIVKCVEALDIVPVDSGDVTGSKSFGRHGPVKALIFGRRHDGYPGVWEVQNDDRIMPVASNESGEKNSKAGDSCEVDWLIHGFFGWQYHVVSKFLGPDTEKGYIIVGYAENTKGIDFGGKWMIDEGTTVAVYWRLDRKRNGHFHLSRARIIGEPNENYAKWNKAKDKEFPHYYRYRHSMFVHFMRYLFANFKFFFLDSFETYLVDVIDAAYDSTKDKYFVTGHVEGTIDVVNPGTKSKDLSSDNKKKKKLLMAVAAIDPYGEIEITIGDGGNGGGAAYERIVIDTFKSATYVGDPEVDLILYDQSGVELTRDESGGPSSIDTFALGLTLVPGTTYYVKVYNKDRAYLGPYALRVLNLATDADIPSAVPPGSINSGDLIDPEDPDSESYEPDDQHVKNVPNNPAATTLGNDNPLNRYLGFFDPVSYVDDDWIVFEIPSP